MREHNESPTVIVVCLSQEVTFVEQRAHWLVDNKMNSWRAL